ncbi:UNVERIFIED_CONTAM: Thiamine pyrophosphokinase [Sesamum latifolium]|uniref:Thiamine pyrophosphokinase n=1 Tax=Sesamum latifolium TaxID=2727402 RepID=A0AAW2Y1S0_9LAMI
MRSISRPLLRDRIVGHPYWWTFEKKYNHRASVESKIWRFDPHIFCFCGCFHWEFSPLTLMQVDIFISGIFMTVVYPIIAYLASGIYCLGTKVVDASHDHGDTTDLHKCVSYIQDLPSLKNQNIWILVAGALGGRSDHEI